MLQYWNKNCELSVRKLIAHLGFNRFASTSNVLNDLESVKINKSWCSIKHLGFRQTDSRLAEWLVSKFVKYNEITEVIRSRSILLKPSRQQARIFRSWAGSYRKAYNLTVELMHSSHESTGKSGSYMKDRKVWIEIIRDKMPWHAEIPAHIIYGAMMDAEKDYRNCVRLRSKGLVSKLPCCKAKFQRSFFVLGSSVTDYSIYASYLGKLKSAETLPYKPRDCRIIFTAGKWWLRVPEKVQTLEADNQGRVCSVDPGIRSFITVFSPRLIAKIQQGGFKRIVRLSLGLDDLISRKTKEKSSKRKRRMQVAIERARLRIRNLIDDLHYQTIGWLFRNFDTVIIPDNNFKSAVCKATRKIRAKSVRALLSYAFSRFRDRLQHKALLLGKAVFTVCESYTTKTHNLTGEIIENLGGSKAVLSKGLKIDRDINGALGIFLKALLNKPEAVVSASLT